MKHTPGPWIPEFQGLKEAKGSWCVLTKEGWSAPNCWIATVEGIRVGPSNQAEIDANANLIAAAPEMYEALRALDQNWTKEGGYDSPDSPRSLRTFCPDTLAIWRAIRAALAKAEGRQ